MPFVPDQQVAAPKGRFVPDAPQGEPEGLLDVLGRGAKQLGGMAAHGVGTVADIARNDVRAYNQQPTVEYGSPESYAAKLSAPFTTEPSRQDLEQQADAAKFNKAVGGAYDTVAGTGPAATTIKENIPPALEAISTVAPIVGKIGGKIAASRAVDAAAAERATGPPQSALEEVQRNGYKITPSSVPVRNPSVKPSDVPGSFRESLTSSPQQTEQIIRDNAVNSTGHIGSDFGAPGATKLLPQHFNAAKVAPGKFYDAAGDAVGTVGEKVPALPETHQTIKAAIADQSTDAPNTQTKVMLGQIEAALDSGKYTGQKLIKNLSFLREQNNPVARAVADQLENEMGNQLKDQPKVLGDFRNARTEFAKIYDAQDATVGGQIDAGVYARLARRRPDLLTGGAAKVAQAGQEIPHLTRLPNPMSDKSPVGSTVLGTVRNLVAPQIAKLPGMDITNPALQRRIGQSAPPPGPLPSPDRLIGPPGAKPTGGLQAPLGEALSPTPGGPVIRPLQRGNKLPQATSLKMTKQLFDQIKRREEQLPGTLEP